MGKEIDIDEDFDFGFTAVPSEEIEATTNTKAERMYNMIMPFLKNLAKDSDKNEYIFWPNRKEKIDEFIEILNQIKDSG